MAVRTVGMHRQPEQYCLVHVLQSQARRKGEPAQAMQREPRTVPSMRVRSSALCTGSAVYVSVYAYVAVCMAVAYTRTALRYYLYIYASSCLRA
jgi:hypothetical protein